MVRKAIGFFAVLALVMSMMAVMAAGVGAQGQTGPRPGDRVETELINTDVSVVEETEITSQECQFNQGGQRSGQQSVTTTTTTTTTTDTFQTTVFKGNSDNVRSVSTSKVVTVTETSETELGQCRNVPGPQR